MGKLLRWGCVVGEATAKYQRCGITSPVSEYSTISYNNIIYFVLLCFDRVVRYVFDMCLLAILHPFRILRWAIALHRADPEGPS